MSRLDITCPECKKLTFYYTKDDARMGFESILKRIDMIQNEMVFLRQGLHNVEYELTMNRNKSEVKKVGGRKK